MKIDRVLKLKILPLIVLAIFMSLLFSCDDGFIDSIVEDTRSKYPSIEIWQGSVKLNSEDICTVDDTQELTNSDFGFQIKNTGEADLELTNPSRVVLDNPDSAFSLVPPYPSTPIAAGGSESFTIRFTPPGTGNYSVKVTVESNVTEIGYYDFTITGTGTPTPIMGVPQNVVAADGASTSQIGITWDVVMDADVYYIYRNTSNSIPASETYTVLGETTTSRFDTDCTPGVLYYYWVKAWNSELGLGSESSSNSGYRKLSPPTANSASNGTSSTWVTVQWSHSAAGGATSYEIYRSTDSLRPSESAAATITGISGSATSYNDDSVDPSIVYYYWIRSVATSSGSKSNWSSSSVNGYRMISTPAIDSVSTSELWEIRLYFYPVAGAESYTFYASLTSSGTYQEVSGSDPVDLYGDGSLYRVIFSGFQWNDGSNDWWECGVNHYFKIRAYNSVTGYSNYSDPSDAGLAQQGG